LLDDIRYRRCDDTFSNGNYNFQLFQYALEKIFEDERKIKEEEEKREEESRPKTSWFSSIRKSNVSIIFSVVMIVFSLGVLGFHYKMYSVPDMKYTK
jgi:hypothetical protein